MLPTGTGTQRHVCAHTTSYQGEKYLRANNATSREQKHQNFTAHTAKRKLDPQRGFTHNLAFI